MKNTQNWRTYFLLLLTLLTSKVSEANVGFWRQQLPSLVISTTAQSLPVEVCSSVTTVRTKSGAGAYTNVASDLTVTLATSGTLTFFSDANCTAPITSIVVASGTSSANFYFMKNAMGAETITLTATAYSLTTQNETGTANGFIWTGGGGNGDWNTAGNWSGGAAPGGSDGAVFDGTCSSNCSPSITSNISVGGIRTFSGYTGTITQTAGFTINIGSLGWIHQAGTFVGGNGNIDVNGAYYLSGGTFTSTSGTLNMKGSTFRTANTPTFNSHSGTVAFSSAGGPNISNVSSITFNNVEFRGNGSSCEIGVTGTMNIAGAMTLKNYGYLSYLGGTAVLNVSGDLNIEGSTWSVTSTVLVKMVGTGTITGSGAGSCLGTLEIATAGTVIFATTGSVDIASDFTYTSGTVVTTGSHVRFVSTATITSGGMSFNDVSFYSFETGYVTYTITGTMSVLGNLVLKCASYGCNTNSGTINVSGSLTTLSTSFGGGTTLIRMVGTGTITGSGSGSAFPQLEIATAGTITFATTNPADLGSSFTYTSGTVVTTGSTVRVIATTGVTFNSGSMVFQNLTFNQNSPTSNTVTGTVHVSGNLSLIGIGYWPANNGGTFEVSGNLLASGAWAGGSSLLVLKGNGVQTVTRSGSANFPGTTITVDNAASVVTLATAVSLDSNQGLTVTAGTVDLAGFALTTKTLSLNSNTLTKNGGVLTVNGSVAGTGSLYGGTINP
jgi:fibronectin-binding autotransporter adhesin